MLDPRPYLLSYVLTITLSLSGLFPLSLSAIIGATLTVLFGINDKLFTFDEALTFIDLDLMALLIGVMMVAEVVDRSGLFRLLALKLIKRTQSKPRHLLVIVPLFAAIVSLLVSDEAALLLSAAILISISRILGIDPKPIALSTAVMVNLGGTGTLIGSIPNMAIGLRAGLDFVEFAAYILPCEFMLYGVTLAYLLAIFKDKVPSEVAVLPEIQEEVNIGEVIKGAFVLVFMLATLIFSSFLGFPASVAAVASAVLALAVCGYDTTEVFRELDWDTVFFTAAFSVIIEVLSKAEALQGLSQLLHSMSTGGWSGYSIVTLLMSAVVSIVIPNLVVALTFIPVVNGLQLHDKRPVWSALVLGVNLPGIALPTSSFVIVMTIGALKREGIHIDPWEVAKIGIPLTFIWLGLAALYILLRFSIPL